MNMRQDWAKHNENEEYHIKQNDNPKSRVNADSPRVNDLLTRILTKFEGSHDLLKGMRDEFFQLIQQGEFT